MGEAGRWLFWLAIETLYSEFPKCGPGEISALMMRRLGTQQKCERERRHGDRGRSVDLVYCLSARVTMLCYF